MNDGDQNHISVTLHFCYLGRHCLSFVSRFFQVASHLSAISRPRHASGSSYLMCYVINSRFSTSINNRLLCMERAKRGDEKRAPLQTIHPNDTPSTLPELMTHHGTGVTLCLSHTITQQSQHIIILPNQSWPNHWSQKEAHTRRKTHITPLSRPIYPHRTVRQK